MEPRAHRVVFRLTRVFYISLFTIRRLLVCIQISSKLN